MTEQTGSYSIEIKDGSNELLAVFTYIDVTSDELQIALTEFRRLLAKMAEAANVNLLALTRAWLAGSAEPLGATVLAAGVPSMQDRLMTDAIRPLEKVLTEADAVIRVRLKEIGLEVPHLVIAVTQEGEVVLRQQRRCRRPAVIWWGFAENRGWARSGTGK